LFVCKTVGRVDIGRKFNGRNHDLVDVMEYLCHKHLPGLSSFMTFLSILDKQFRL
jgi:hypothetical protein